MCGKLVKSLYGARDVAVNWMRAYMGFMVEMGFVKRGNGARHILARG